MKFLTLSLNNRSVREDPIVTSQKLTHYLKYPDPVPWAGIAHLAQKRRTNSSVQRGLSSILRGRITWMIVKTAPQVRWPNMVIHVMYSNMELHVINPNMELHVINPNMV